MSDSDIVQDFLVESYENLDRLDRELVGLEKNPQDRDALASVFRTIHTIKGTCGFLGFNQLEKVAHVGENLLTRLRDGQLTLNRELTTALLEMVDAVRQMLGSIEATGGEGKRDDTKLIATLTRLQQLPEAQAVSKAAPLPATTPEGAASPASIGDILMQTTGVTSAEIQFATEKQKEGDPRRLGEILVEQGAVQPGDIVDALRIQQSSRAHTGASDSTIRVDIGLLDKVMNSGRGVGAGAQSGPAIRQPHERHRLSGRFPSFEPDHHGTASGRHEDPHAADRKHLGPISAHRARRGARLWQGSGHRDGGQRDRTGQNHYRSD